MTVEIDLASAIVDETLDTWRDEGLVARIWDKDPTVWFDPPRPEIENRLGWLDLPTASEALVDDIMGLATAAASEGITDLVLCGMGGSSLAPEVFAATLPATTGQPRLTVVDTTHPDGVERVHRSTHPRSTWYLVSSKSGGTLETMSLFRSFWSSAAAELDDPGSHFLAVTDPGSALARLADQRGFRSTILADPDVGGRYSALSAFGLVPAGIVGADVRRLLASGREAASRCGADVDVASNPGALVGLAMGSAARQGRVIARFAAGDPMPALPIWIEQLIAESTGKDGRGIVPIDGGPVPASRDRAIEVSIGSRPDPSADIRITVTDPYDIAAVMFVLEFATAVAGADVGIHPFDQPDVQLAKTLAHRAMEGDLPSGGPRPLDISGPGTLHGLAGDQEPPLYIAIQAYVAPSESAQSALDDLRVALTEHFDTFVTVGYGPRFLHSTGQLHKGGPSGGMFIQLIDRPHIELPVPEEDYTFNELVAAQAAGDRSALGDRDRSVMALQLGADPVTAIERLTDWFTS
jgi:transaldolase/glucose-6-phosphate isomerase